MNDSAELAFKALDAIDKVTNQANFYLTLLALIIGLAAIFGWAILQNSAVKAAETIAKDRVKRFLASPEGAEFVRRLISDEITSQLETKAFGAVEPPPDDDLNEPFPTTPRTEGSGQ